MDLTERITVAVAALLLTHAAALYFRVGAIENDLLSQTRAALANRGLADVQVRVSGRDLTLAGQVPDRRAAAQALALARRTTGVRVVHDAMQTAR
jgi:osmotically-inducible protein OsmY